MKPDPVVSVVMPVFNAKRYVGEAVQSILNQTYKDFEMIAVDDASTDGSGEVLRSFEDPRLVVLTHDTNGGYPVAMNTGLSQARGRYMARMDADDVSDARRLERQVAFLERHPEYGMVASRALRLTPNGYTYNPEPYLNEAYVSENWEDVMNGARLFTDGTVLVERSLVEAVGGYRTYRRSGQDVDLWLRILELGRPMATLTEPLYGRRVLPSALTFGSQTIAKNKIPRLLALERRRNGTDAVMQGDAPPAPEDEGAGKEAREWRVQALWTTAIRCLEAGDLPGGWSFAKAAFAVAEPNPVYLKTTLRHLARGIRLLPTLIPAGKVLRASHRFP